jgi:hypothetical protein
MQSKPVQFLLSISSNFMWYNMQELSRRSIFYRMVSESCPVLMTPRYGTGTSLLEPVSQLSEVTRTMFAEWCVSRPAVIWYCPVPTTTN